MSPERTKALAEIIGILKLTASQRTDKQASSLQELTKSIRFFMQLTQENGEFVHRAVCEKLTYEFFPIDSYVFQLGSFGNKFYILIEGEVSVVVPLMIAEETQMKTVAHLKAGMSFGELALIKDQARSASILCDTDCHFAVLSKENYMNIIGKIESRKLEDFINFLHDIPMFRHWTKRKLEVFTYYFNKQTYKRKQTVFTKDSIAHSVFIVKSGEFELSRPLSINDKSKGMISTKVALLAKGEVFGDESVLNNKPYAFTCTCYSTVGELLRISAEDFKLKLYDELSVKEFQKKKRSKDSLRNSRIKGFKKYLESSRVETEVINEIEVSKDTFSSKASKPFRSPQPASRIKRLTEGSLEKIKKKALGREKLGTDYIALKLKSAIRDLNKSTVLSPARISSKVMKSHRPGGYFRANLKRSRMEFNSISTIRDKVYN